MNLQPGAHLPGGPIRSWQLGAVLLPFLLPLISPLPILLLLAALAPQLPWGGGREPAASQGPNAPLQASE